MLLAFEVSGRAGTFTAADMVLKKVDDEAMQLPGN